MSPVNELVPKTELFLPFSRFSPPKMALWPDLVFQLLPGFGLFASCTSLIYLVVMRRVQPDGFFAAVYALRAMDFLLGFSLLYAGFYGIHLSVQYGNEQDARQMPPFQCLFTALHLHVWVFTDTAQLLLLALLCADQFISVVWTKRHKEFSSVYLHPGSILLVLLLSAGTLVPAWSQPILLADNSTIQISSFCAMPEAFGEHFYAMSLEVRKWAPLAAVAALCLTAFAVLALQFAQKGRFKWSDNNGQSAQFLSLILCRALLLSVSVHVPLLHFRFRLSPLARHAEWRAHAQEIAIRAWQALLVGLCQPLLDALLLPQFMAKIGEFFNLKEMKRNWQSADDPPMPNRSVATSGWEMFGSFHSTGGNIIGEAGIPMELNADVQRSVSFYYRDDE